MRSNIFLKAAIFIVISAGLATAHPLGNFTVNHYSRIEVANSQIKLRAVLDHKSQLFKDRKKLTPIKTANFPNKN